MHSSKKLAYTMASTKYYLLELPAELKAYIYELAMTRAETLWTIRRLHYTIYHGITHQLPRRHAQPPLTRVCREIRLEVLPLHYARNTFGFTLALFHIGGSYSASLGNMAPFVQYLKKIRIAAGCTRDCTFEADLFSGVTLLLKEHVEDSKSESEVEDSEVQQACACEKTKRVRAQAVVDRFMARRRPGEGWSEAEVLKLIDCFRRV